MKYILLTKVWYGYCRFYNDTNMGIIEDFLMLDVGPFAESFLEFLTIEPQKSNAGNACLIEKKGDMITLGYSHDENETVYLSMANKQMQKILMQWEKVYPQQPNFILITQNDQKEINLEGFDTEQEVRNKMRSFGLAYPNVDN